MSRSILLTVVVVAFALSASAGAAPVTIPNAGFEGRATWDPFTYGTDKYNWVSNDYWRHFECNNNGGPLRVWKPGDPGNPAHLTTQGIADVGFGGHGAEGDYVVVVRSRYNDNEFHDPPQVRDFEAAVQLLNNELFDSTMTYTLSAAVGRMPETEEGGSVNYDPNWYGYALQFAVGGSTTDFSKYGGWVEGGTLLAQDQNSRTVPPNTWVYSTVTYTPNPADSIYDGLPLQIRLCALENPLDHALTGWAAFDDVKLDKSFEPVVPPALVRDRRVFYNNSAFDANGPVLEAGDQMAIATDKTAFRLPDGTATFDNYTSFHRGINGMVIDIDDLAHPESLDTEHVTDYFEFRVGNDEDPSAWDYAPPIEDVLVLPGQGIGGSDRVMVTWEDGSIRNEWLRVTVVATEQTGLDAEDVFYFGNAVAESGNSSDNALVTVADLLLARNNPHTFLDPAGIGDSNDFNRDGRVNATDVLLARNNQTSFLDCLELISPPAPAAATPIAPVPEPSTFVLIATGVVALLLHRRRRRSR